MFNYSTSLFTPQQIAYTSQPSQQPQIQQTQIQQPQIQQTQIQQSQIQQTQIQQSQIQQTQIQQSQIQQTQIQQSQIQQTQIQQPQIQPQIQQQIQQPQIPQQIRQPQIQQPQIPQQQMQQPQIQQPKIQQIQQQIQQPQMQQIQIQQTQMQQATQISHQSQITQPINSQNIINSNELTGISSPHFNIYEVQNPTFMVNNNTTLCQQNQIYTQSPLQRMPECTNQIETISSQTSISQTVVEPTFQTGSANHVIGFVDSNPSMNKIFNGNNQPQWNNKESQQIVDIQKQIQNKLYIDSEEDTLSSSSSTSSNFSKGKIVKCPVNSFMIFCSKRRKELSSQNPALTTSEVSVILGDEWTNMSEEEKNEFVLQNPILENELEVEHPEYIYTQISNNSKKRSIQSTEDILGLQNQNQQVNYTSYVCSYPFNQQPYSATPQQVAYKYPVVQIKQSPNAFILFSADYRQKIKDENPDSSPGVISKLVGNAWKNLPEEEKHKYYEESKRLRNENNELKKIAKAQQKNLKTMNKTSSSGVYSPYGQAQREFYTPYNYNYPPSTATGVMPPISVLPPQKRVRTPKDPTQPKHPSSAFLFYFQDVRSQYMSKYSKKSLGAVSKMISEAWKKLTPEEKAKYIEKSEQDKKRYNQEMKVWQENNKKQTKEKEKEKEKENNKV